MVKVENKTSETLKISEVYISNPDKKAYGKQDRLAPTVMREAVHTPLAVTPLTLTEEPTFKSAKAMAVGMAVALDL